MRNPKIPLAMQDNSGFSRLTSETLVCFEVYAGNIFYSLDHLGNSVLDVLESTHEYSTALEMFRLANISEGLAAGDNFTVIVPSNKAYKVGSCFITVLVLLVGFCQKVTGT